MAIEIVVENIEIFRALLSKSRICSSPHRMSEFFGVTERTVRNWLTEKTPCPAWAILTLRKDCMDRHPFRFSNIAELEQGAHEQSFLRLKSTSTCSDIIKLYSYIYFRTEKIERIIFFSRKPTDRDCNKHLFACLMISKDEHVLLDTTACTACRQPRENEIIELFTVLHNNDLHSRIELISDQLLSTHLHPVKQACEMILEKKTQALTADSINDYLLLIRGSVMFSDPSEYLKDGGVATIVRTAKEALDKLKINFTIDENKLILLIKDDETFNEVSRTLHYAFTEVYGKMQDGFFYKPYEGNFLKLQFPETYHQGKLIITWELIDEDTYYTSVE
jgi:hypothetical protein